MISDTLVLALFGMFVIKHFIADFPLQTIAMVQEKGQYGKFGGIAHSAIHGLFTVMIVIIAGAIYDPFYAREYLILSFVLGFIDFVLHYHIDWAKMNINRIYKLTPTDNAFWIWLGVDQLLHYLTYILIIGAIIFAF